MKRINKKIILLYFVVHTLNDLCLIYSGYWNGYDTFFGSSVIFFPRVQVWNLKFFSLWKNFVVCLSSKLNIENLIYCVIVQQWFAIYHKSFRLLRTIFNIFIWITNIMSEYPYPLRCTVQISKIKSRVK